MKRTFVLAAVLALSGCSSFKLGGFAYCPFGLNCEFQQHQQVPLVKPAASGVSA